MIRKQLQKFYAVTQPGLTPKQLRLAIRFDIKAINRAMREQSYPLGTGAGGSIAGSFVWDHTPEGRDYWLRRNACIADAKWDWS